MQRFYQDEAVCAQLAKRDLEAFLWTRSEPFLVSPDALEVIVVTNLLIVSTDLTDVTLVSDDTY